MIKVCSIMDPKYRFVIRRHRSFFKHAPDFISCTTAPEEADIFLSHMACNGRSGCGHFNFPAPEEVFFRNLLTSMGMMCEIVDETDFYQNQVPTEQIYHDPHARLHRISLKPGRNWVAELQPCNFAILPFSANLRKNAGFMTFFAFYARNAVTKRVYIK